MNSSVQSSSALGRSQGDSGSTTLRRVRGPLADELYLYCLPLDSAVGAVAQAESAYTSLKHLLASEEVSTDCIVTETLFLQNVANALPLIADARRKVMGPSSSKFVGPATTLIGQAPLGGSAEVAIAATALVHHAQPVFPSFEVARACACDCSACSCGARAKAVSIGDQTHLHAGNIYGLGSSTSPGAGGDLPSPTGVSPSPMDEAFSMFCEAEALLTEAGMTFRDVVRTWIYLRDIDRDYDALNQARRKFFASRGVERRPASTGVQGIPVSGAHNFTLSFCAVKSPQPLDAPLMSTPTLNEAWTYGADFSRGLIVTDANKTALHLSGTASIDEQGQSVHIGDLTAQADRMLRNISTLLEEQGVGFERIVSAVTYVKFPKDASALCEILRDRGFEGFPCAIVEAPLCRPELLCETEAVAILPLPEAGSLS